MMISDNLEEPQLNIEYSRQTLASPVLGQSEDTNTLNILSLFSGCGGMDLGFEGNFQVPSVFINKNLSDDFIEEDVDENFALLKKHDLKQFLQMTSYLMQKTHG